MCTLGRTASFYTSIFGAQVSECRFLPHENATTSHHSTSHFKSSIAVNGVNRRDAIVGAATALFGVTSARAMSLNRVIIVDGWVVKQSELRTA